MRGNKKKILVLSGGGAHTVTYLGVWQFIHEKIYREGEIDERYIPDYIVGTSGGALFGCFMAARKNGRLLSGREIKEELIKQKPWKLVSINAIEKLINLFSWGLIDIKRIRRRIKSVLEEYNIDWNTFTKPKYECVVTNLTEGKRQYIPTDSAMDLDAAITASITVPGIFTPLWYSTGSKVEKHCYVDGGVCEGFPVKAALRMGRENVKIMAISPFSEPKCHDIDRLKQYLMAIFHTLLDSKQEDMRSLLSEDHGDIHLVTGSFASSLLDFRLTTINKNYDRGYEIAQENEEKITKFFVEE